MITKYMIECGYNGGLIRLINSPNGDGIVCGIGDNWFYFGGYTAEEYDVVEEYKNDVPTETIIQEIFDVLQDFHSEFLDEYLYYEYYLKENGIQEKKNMNEFKTSAGIITTSFYDDGIAKGIQILLNDTIVCMLDVYEPEDGEQEGEARVLVYKKEYDEDYPFDDCEICGSRIFKKRIKVNK